MILNLKYFLSLIFVFIYPYCVGIQSSFAQAEKPPLKIDHIPIAVNDLLKSENFYKSLGFSIKSGTLHKNSIENRHIKFSDGSALELITASSPTDDLSKYYLDFLKQSEGIAFLAFDGGEVSNIFDSLKNIGQGPKLTKLGYATTLSFDLKSSDGNLFFIEYKRKIKDEFKYLDHKNTAYGIHAVWMTQREYKSKENLFGIFNLNRKSNPLNIPLLENKTLDIELERGHLYVVDDINSNLINNGLIGYSIKVRSIESAVNIIDQNYNIKLTTYQTEYGKSIFLPKSISGPMKIELIELN